MKCYYCENFEKGWCKWMNEKLSEEMIEDEVGCSGENNVVMDWNNSTL